MRPQKRPARHLQAHLAQRFLGVERTLSGDALEVEAGRLAGYRDGGVNRVSMGIQALNDTDLRRLGRIHTGAEAHRALDIARNTLARVSFDLIYARQDQTLRQWRNELTQALSMAVDHLSLYQLTIEAGTAFGAFSVMGEMPVCRATVLRLVLRHRRYDDAVLQRHAA